MSKDLAFNFDEALKIVPVYTTTHRFLQPFFEFESSLSSLQRFHWFVTKYISWYLESTRSYYEEENLKHEDNLYKEADYIFDSASYIDMLDEMVIPDQENFCDMLHGFVLSRIFSLTEKLLNKIVDEVTDLLSIKAELDNEKGPQIKKYMNFLENKCDFPIQLDKDTWNTLDSCRKMRNRFVHNICRDIPLIQRQLETILESSINAGADIDNNVVNEAFNTIGIIASEIERCYWLVYDNVSGCDD